MLNTFLMAKGYNIGASLCEPSFVEKAIEILNLAEVKNCTIVLASEFVVAKDLESEPKIKDLAQIEADDIIFDISPNDINRKMYTHILNSNQILWNGPVGMFEHGPYHEGSFQIIHLIEEAKTKNQSLVAIAGGGDSVSLINRSKKKKVFDFISTAGGAFLEYISGKTLPGLHILEKLKGES